MRHTFMVLMSGSSWVKIIIEALIHIFIRALSGNYPAILNISRSSRVALMYLGSRSEETLMGIREQSLSCGASQ